MFFFAASEECQDRIFSRLPHPFAPVATVLGAMVLALACVGLLLFFIHHISEAISVNHIVDRIAEETEAMIDEIMPWPYRPTPERPCKCPSLLRTGRKKKSSSSSVR